MERTESSAMLIQTKASESWKDETGKRRSDACFGMAGGGQLEAHTMTRHDYDHQT